MTGWVWAAIFIGLAIVILAVGVPWMLAHRGIREPYDRSDAEDYIRAKRRWRRGQRARQGRPEEAGSGQGVP